MRSSVRLGRAIAWSAVTIGYVLLTCLLTWPLPRHLRTHLLGDPGGDLGVYVWNLWIFRHELFRHGHLPFSTQHVFGFTGGADFSLHNYAPLAGALGAPLVGPFGVVGAFNLMMLTAIATSGLGVFVLTRRLGVGTAAAWCAGALFMASPVLTAKETAHFSLVMAAPLPLFLWALLRALDLGRVRDAVLVGAVVATAFYADAYYAIYCALMGAFLIAWRLCRIEWPETVTAWPRVAAGLHVLMLIVGAVVVWRLWGAEEIRLGPLQIRLRTLYTPLLVGVLAAALLAWLHWRPALRLDLPQARLTALLRLGLVSVLVCLVLAAPPLIGLTLRFANGRLPDTETLWRSSPRGLDLLAFFVPNPSQTWLGDWTRPWFLPPQSDAFPEFVGSFSLAALAVVAVAAWLRLLPRMWVVFTLVFAWLSIGPFMHVAGVNTYIVGPWAFLRYLPVIGMARSPARFAIVAALGLSILVAFAIEGLRRRAIPRWAGALLAAVIAIELLPAPRPLFSAAVPDVYRLVSAETASEEVGRLLELPMGIRDGTSSMGDFNASSAYFQTSHRRPMIGGYLSRVSGWRKAENERAPMLRALIVLSAGGTLSAEDRAEALRGRDTFLERSCVRFVVVNKHRASTDLQAFAIESLGLMRVYDDPDYALLKPTVPPACLAPSQAPADHP